MSAEAAPAEPPVFRLADLPHEIIHEIAIHCDGEGALSLSRTSKYLRRICYTWLVFKPIVCTLACHGDNALQDDDEDVVIQRNTFRLAELSAILESRTESWARYAVALTRLANLENSLKGVYKMTKRTTLQRIEQYLHCMPQLSCLGYTPRHPICATTDFVEGMVHASRAQGRLTPHRGTFGVSMPCATALEPALSFSFAIEILRGDLRHRANIVYRETGQQFDPRGITLNVLLEELSSMLVKSARKPPFWIPGGAHIVVAAFSYFLVLREGEPHPFYRPRVKPPAVDRLPLLDPDLCAFTPHINDPFSAVRSARTGMAGSAVVPPMTAAGAESIRGLIADGPWCGYYGWNERLAQLEAPMQNVRMTVVDEEDEEQEQETSSAVIVGSGVDGVGEFTLTGHIDLFEAGDKPFVMRKEYTTVQQAPWVWEGFVTAFGLVGVWRGNERGTREVHGVFWLWRDDWQPPKRH